MGGGGCVVDEVPRYDAYGMYPGSERWVPAYGGSFDIRSSPRRSGLGYYFDNHGYEDDPLDYYYVDVPVRSGASFARRRKLNESTEENSKPRGQDVSDIFMHPDFVNSNAASVREDVPPPPPRTGKKPSQPRVVSIPVSSSEGGNDDKKIFTVKPEVGIKKPKTGAAAERAAVLMQSRFRGGLVRKTQPLVHLRKIATVRSELARLNQKVLDPDFIAFARENETGRLKLMETIMRLLLELDAVQDAHPLVRDIRKSTCKQVIALQERVDEILSGRMETMVGHQEINRLQKGLPAMQEDVLSRQQPALDDEPEPTGKTSSAKCEAVDYPCLSESKYQVTTSAEHDDYGKKAELNNLKKVDSQFVEPTTVEDELANNEPIVIPLVQHRIEPLEEIHKYRNFGAECDLSHLKASEAERVQIREEGTLIRDGQTPHVASAKVEATFMDEGSGNQESSADLTPPTTVVKMDEETGSLQLNSEISNFDANANTVQLESEINSSLASDIELRTSQAAPAMAEASIDEEDKEWWIDDRCNDNITSKVDDDCQQSDIPELYGDKNISTKILLEKANMPSTNLQNDFIPADQTILTMPCVQNSALPYQNHVQREHELQMAEYLDMSQARDSNCRKFPPTSGNDVKKILGKDDDRSLLFKLGEQNEILKSLLMGVIKWNQIQAITMQDVNRRLNQLESRRSKKSPKLGRKIHRTMRTNQCNAKQNTYASEK